MKSEKPRYMLDANAFDYILDQALDAMAVRNLGEIYITQIQHAELLNVTDPVRRKRLFQVLSIINPIVYPASAGMPLPDRHQKVRDKVQATRKEAHSDGARRFYGKSRKWERWKDAAIGDVTRLAGFTLVTEDRSFRRRAVELGVTALSCAEVFAGL